jgi:hypothetical protein
VRAVRVRRGEFASGPAAPSSLTAAPSSLTAAPSLLTEVELKLGRLSNATLDSIDQLKSWRRFAVVAACTLAAGASRPAAAQTQVFNQPGWIQAKYDSYGGANGFLGPSTSGFQGAANGGLMRSYHPV